VDKAARHKENAQITEEQLAEDESQFHSSYRVFLEAVRMLALPAADQCRMMGNYNVAWELKDDVAAGKYLVDRGYLDEAQEAWVTALVGSLEAAPTLVLSAGAGFDANVVAMSKPCWEPLRFLAAEVLVRIEPFSRKNAEYLGLA
jgi:hypothetical protein